MMALETFVIIFIVFFCIIPLGFAIIAIIGQYKMFEKAGVEGWKAIIPLYNLYVAGTEVGKLNSGWGIAALIGLLVPGIGSIVTICATININYAVAKKFGEGDTGVILTILFAPIMYCVYGFGKATYNRNIDVPEHGLFSGVVSSVTGTNNTNTNKSTNDESSERSERKFCPSCGSPVKPTDKFCKSCGNPLK